MTKLLLFSLSLILAVSACQQKSNTQANMNLLRVLSYNIHHANPPSHPDKIDLDAIAKVIQESRADLVGLQEIDVHTLRSGKALNQAVELGKMTDMHVYFSKGIDYQGGEYGTVILSKFPIKESRRYELPNLEDVNAEPRTLAVVTVEVGEKELKFANTHLDYTNAENNLLQAQRIVEIFESEPLPVIMVGDFNAVPESASIQLLDQHFFRSCTDGCGFTVPQVQPRRTIDYIMVNKEAALQVMEHQVIDEPYASDHLPVLAVYKLGQ